MPAGCDFICKNNNCENFNKGFVITGPWPIARIEMVIASNVIQRKPEYKEELINLKKQGKKYTCLVYPNYKEIEPVGIRVNLWSPKALCIWSYELLFEEGQSVEALMDKYLPDKCPKTECDLLNFNDVVQDGIVCPSCNQKMFQNRWFTNED